MPPTQPKKRHISVCEPFYAGRELEYAKEALDSGWISSSGRYIREFEEKFSAFSGTKYGVSTTSGTTALHLAFRAIGLKEGDEIVLPNFTMIACAAAVLYCGAKPVFVDAEADTWNMNPALIEETITPQTKAILAVHTYGHPCDMDPLLKIAKKHKLLLIEDAAEAHGGLYNQKPCGSLGDLACFSFYANKIITTGEGGMVVTNNEKFADRCRYYKNLCFPLKGPRRFQHDDVGYNYRMTNVQAAIGLGQLEKAPELIKRRRDHAHFYNSQLENTAGIQCPVQKPYAQNVYWMYGLLIDPQVIGMNRDMLAQKLKDQGVETRPFFRPLHLQKAVTSKFPSGSKTYPVTENLAQNGFYLPSGSGLTEDDLQYICETLKNIIK